jgi:threonylcarbamoyladenosine tRNA methylthiotransferase MtaB
VVQQRSRVLRELSERQKAAFYRNFDGRTLRVLFERRDKSGRYTGFTDNYIKVGVSTHAEIANQLLPVRFDGMADGMVLGSLATEAG